MALLPNESYQVYCHKRMNEDEWVSLTSLYQPVIGSFAMNLYQTLILQGQFENKENFLHLDLCNTLDLGIQQLEQAREKLEGLGLLKVYCKEEEFNTSHYLYEILLPMPAAAFLKDEVLSFLLLEKVGETNYQRLISRFSNDSILTEGFQEITKTFKEVYTINQQKLANTLNDLQQNKDKIASPSIAFDYQHDATNSGNIDWQFLFDLATKKFISKDKLTEAVCRKLAIYHSLYGYDEFKLIDLLTQSVQYSTGEIDEKILEQQAIAQSKTLYTSKMPTSEEENQMLRKDRLLKQGFSEADWQLIVQCETYFPMEYLQEVKRLKNSFTTKQEEWLIRDLVERSPLSNAVINVLINYLLVIQNKTNLSPQLTGKIATDWSEKKIQLPEQAISHVRQIVKESKEKQKAVPVTRKNYPNRNVRIEEIPEWMKSPPQEVKNPEGVAAAKKALDALLNKEGEK